MRFPLENLKGKPIRKQERICHAEAVLKSKKTKHREPLTFYFRYTIDAPFNESSAASSWRMNTGFLKRKSEEFTCRPCKSCSCLSTLYVKLRCKSMREDHPPHVPHHISKILELDITRWEILGPAEYEPNDFNLSIKGTLF
ncbi:hypothetical protein ACFX2G_024071 [Malus domestica]